jgi:hypothetical protein
VDDSNGGTVLAHPTAGRAGAPAHAAPDDKFVDFDIHGRIGIRVERSAPTVSVLREMLEPFETTRGLARIDMTVSARHLGTTSPSHAEHSYRYTESTLLINGMDVEIHFGDSVRLSGTREMITTLIPVLDAIGVQHDLGMIHAAMVSYHGHGIAMPAWGGVGKTSTCAKLLRLPDVGFMGDDWGFISGAGELLGYWKPMFIKPHHKPIYPHLFEGTRKPLIPSELSKPLSQLATLVHPVITKHPRLAGFTRRWSPEHMMVTPRQAFPHAAMASVAPLATSVFVERFEGHEAILEVKDPAWMVSRIIGNFHSELPGHSRDVITALGATGLVPLERFYGEKQAILTRALGDLPCFWLRVPVTMPADVASDVIVEQLHGIFRTIGID